MSSSWPLSLPTTATAQGAAELAQELAARPLDSVRVLVLTSGHDVTDPRVYARQARSLRQLGAEVTIVGVVTRGVPEDVAVIRVPTARTRLHRFLLQPWRCLWKARHEACDVVHFHDAEMLAILPVARLWWPKAVFVYDVHEDFANLMLIRSWIPQWLKPAVKLVVNTLEKWLARLAHGIVGVTPPLTRKFGHRHSATAFNFTSQEFFDTCATAARPPAAREFDVVHLGTLNDRRALFLSEVLEHVHQLRPQARSLIIGVRPEVDAVLRPRLPRNCTVLPRTDYAAVPELLGNSRLGLDVHPWLGAHLQVAVPVKLCEYMAAGCAVVCSSMPVLDALLEDAGALPHLELLRGGTALDYAEAILRTLNAIDAGADPGAPLRLIAREHMVWEKEARKIAALYLALLGRQARPL